MTRLPRIRACRFSSAIPGSVPPKCGRSRFSYADITSAMANSITGQPRLAAIVLASSWVAELECGEGMITQLTRSAPRASAAISATSAESMPPERPRTA